MTGGTFRQPAFWTLSRRLAQRFAPAGPAREGLGGAAGMTLLEPADDEPVPAMSAAVTVNVQAMIAFRQCSSGEGNTCQTISGRRRPDLCCRMRDTQTS